MSPSKNPIVWDVAGLHLDADPAATLALDRSAWENAGARFTAADDGQGEAPGLALAQIETTEGSVTVGIVDDSRLVRVVSSEWTAGRLLLLLTVLTMTPRVVIASAARQSRSARLR